MVAGRLPRSMVVNTGHIATGRRLVRCFCLLPFSPMRSLLARGGGRHDRDCGSFPLKAPRAHFIAKQARRVAELSPTAGEKHIAAQIKVQRDALMRKGVNAELIKREMTQLESAIRAAIWAAVLTPSGAA